MTETRRTPDWRGLLRSWDVQQESFNPDRERRFAAMLDVLAAALPSRFTALDLGSGPGSLSVRILRRFPLARVVAVDNDPVTLRIGRGALGNYRGRLSWVEAKLGERGWTDRLPRGKFDAAVSTSALHWLTERDLRSLYRDLGRRLRPGGVFLDGDYIAWGEEARGVARLSNRIWRRRFPGNQSTHEWKEWTRWWARTEKIPALRAEFAERARRNAVHPKHADVPLSVHRDALTRAGFRATAVVWDDFGNRVLFARR